MTLETLTEAFYFLDDLRASGATNMWGATPYLLEEFPDLSPTTIRWVHTQWMGTLQP